MIWLLFLLCVPSRKSDFNFVLCAKPKKVIWSTFFSSLCAKSPKWFQSLFCSLRQAKKWFQSLFFLLLCVCGSLAESLWKKWSKKSDRTKWSHKVIEKSDQVSSFKFQASRRGEKSLFEHFLRSLVSNTFFDSFFSSDSANEPHPNTARGKKVIEITFVRDGTESKKVIEITFATWHIKKKKSDSNHFFRLGTQIRPKSDWNHFSGLPRREDKKVIGITFSSFKFPGGGEKSLFWITFRREAKSDSKKWFKFQVSNLNAPQFLARQAEKSDLNHFFFFMCQVAKVILITFLKFAPSRKTWFESLFCSLRQTVKKWFESLTFFSSLCAQVAKVILITFLFFAPSRKTWFELLFSYGPSRKSDFNHFLFFAPSRKSDLNHIFFLLCVPSRKSDFNHFFVLCPKP